MHHYRYSKDLSQGGLDVPCSLRFTGNDEVKCKKLENSIRSSLAETGVEYPNPYALPDTSVAGTTSQQVTTTVMVKKETELHQDISAMTTEPAENSRMESIIDADKMDTK